MALKVTLFFTQGTRGWTETFYTAASVLPTERTADLERLAKWAMSFRSLNTVMTAMRFSDEEKPNSVAVFGTLDIKPSLFSGQTDPLPDIVSTDINVRTGSETGKRRMYKIRGLFDGLVTRDSAGNDVLAPQYVGTIQNYFSNLKKQGFGIRAQLGPLDGVGINIVNVIALRPDPTNAQNALLVTKEQLTGPGLISKIRVRGGHYRNELPGFPRTMPVLFQDHVGAEWLYTIPYRIRSAGSVAPKSLFVSNLRYAYSAFANWSFAGYSTRRTGRPTGVPRGRGSVVFRRQ